MSATMSAGPSARTAAGAAESEPVARYDAIAMTLHWLVAAFIMINIFVGLAAVNAAPGDDRRLMDMHKSLGLTVLGLVVLRILWRLARRPPPLPRAYSRLERIAAHGAHVLLYAVMLVLPLTGYIHDSAWKLASTHPIVLYGVAPFPRIGAIQSLDPGLREQVHTIFGDAHVTLGYVLYALLAAHLLGVAKHHALDRAPELQRMLPARGRSPGAAD